MTRDSGEVQSVIRACSVLSAFRQEGESLQLSDIVSRTRLSRTTAFRLLQSLCHGGLLERVGRGVYQTQVRALHSRPFRLGFAAQTESEFCREVIESMHRAAIEKQVQLITVNNRYSRKEALRNADLLIRERVDLVIEYQTYESMAPIIATKFLQANMPVIAVEVPHPGATYFGADNYQAGLIGGRALGRWAKDNWDGHVEQVILMELPIAGSLPQLRVTGMLVGLRAYLPELEHMTVVHLDGKGEFDQILDNVRKHLRRTPLKRTLVAAVNDTCALAALRAFEEVGGNQFCAVMGQNAIRGARNELRRSGTRLIGTVAYFPERYGDSIISLALGILQKRPMPPAVFVKHQLITAKNVNLIYPLDHPA